MLPDPNSRLFARLMKPELGLGLGLGLTGAGASFNPLNAGAKIAAMGDSIVRRNHDPSSLSTPGEISTNSKGALSFCWQMDHRFTWYGYYNGSPTNVGGPNKGITGQTTSQMLARFTTDIINMSKSPDILYLAAGTNNLRDATNNTGAQIFNDLKAMVDLWFAAFPEKPAILSTIRAMAPVSAGLTFGLTPEQQAELLAANDLIRSYAGGRRLVFLADAYNAYAQPDGYADTTLLEDGLHPNSWGTIREATSYLLPRIRQLIKPGNVLETGPNLYPFDFTTTGGTVANGVTGNTPAGMHATRTAGSGATTVVSSIGAGADTGAVIFTVSPGGSVLEQFRLSTNSTFNTIAVPDGAWLRFMVDVEASDYPWQLVQVELYRDDTSTSYRSVGNRGTSVLIASTTDRGLAGAYTIASEAIPCTGTTASIQVRMIVGIDGNKPGNGATIKWKNPRLVVVANPNTL